MRKVHSSPVLFFPVVDDGEPDLNHAPLAKGISRLVGQLDLPVSAGDSWGLKVQLGGRGLPASVDPRWVAAAGQGLMSGHFAFDTLSITQEGLHTVADQQACALAKGYGPDLNGMEYQVADDPQQGPAEVLGQFRLAAAAAEASGLLILSTVRPHPHLGFQGALAALGLGLSDRQGKLEVHEDIRPQVDTPLCAGCGSCLDVCLFDAIQLKAGRAMIDHTRCTGCGECMTVCHMAGISPEDAASIPVFQEKVAAAGTAFSGGAGWGRSGKIAYFNFLLNLDRRQNRSNRRRAGRKQVGILASTDPVALDQASWDLLADQAGGSLSLWTGYLQEPGALLAEAAAAGLGKREYHLIEHN